MEDSLHPLTRGPLLDEAGFTCGQCARLVRDDRWFKCELYRTDSPLSDVRVWWPACERFVAGE